VSRLPPVSFSRYQSVSFVAVPPRSLQLYMYGTGSKTPGESDTLTRDTCSGKKTPGAAGSPGHTRTGNHWLKTMLKTMLKTWLKTKLFAFHAQKRTHFTYIDTAGRLQNRDQNRRTQHVPQRRQRQRPARAHAPFLWGRVRRTILVLQLYSERAVT
jgi:hypothetical protein